MRKRAYEKPAPIVTLDQLARTIGKEADARAGATQLSLAEVAPDQPHALARIEPTLTGKRAHCSCGAPLPIRDTGALALREWRAHVARTPQGAALMRTFRRTRRYGHR